METGRPRPSNEEETQRATKQHKTSHGPSREAKRADSQFLKPQAWLPAPILSGKPLMDDASIRDFNGGIGCHVASALEQTLLLPKDMVELRGFRRSEVFLHTKRFLAMVCTYSPWLFLSFFFFFDIILILSVSFQSYSKYIQARWDNQLPLSVARWGEEKLQLDLPLPCASLLPTPPLQPPRTDHV